MKHIQKYHTGAHKVVPNQMDHALSQRETNLDRYAHVIAVPDMVDEEDFPHVSYLELLFFI